MFICSLLQQEIIEFDNSICKCLAFLLYSISELRHSKSLHYIRYSVKFILYIFQRGDFFFGLFQVQASCVIAIELRKSDTLCVAFFEIFIVIECAVVSWNTVKVSHVLCFGTLLIRQKSFIEFFSMSYSDNLYVSFELLCSSFLTLRSIL